MVHHERLGELLGLKGLAPAGHGPLSLTRLVALAHAREQGIPLRLLVGTYLCVGGSVPILIRRSRAGTGVIAYCLRVDKVELQTWCRLLGSRCLLAGSTQRPYRILQSTQHLLSVSELLTRWANLTSTTLYISSYS